MQSSCVSSMSVAHIVLLRFFHVDACSHGSFHPRRVLLYDDTRLYCPECYWWMFWFFSFFLSNFQHFCCIHSCICLLEQVRKHCPGNSQDGTWGKPHPVTPNFALLVMQTCNSTDRVTKSHHWFMFSSTLGATGFYIFCQPGRYTKILKRLLTICPT